MSLADLTALNYTILVPYNNSIATGGDSLTENVNVFYTVRSENSLRREPTHASF